ncbi:MAG: hypothetical protein AAF724_09495 [Pseudomonadota bacterium]
MNSSDEAKVASRLSASEKLVWKRRKRQLIATLNALSDKPDMFGADKIKRQVIVPILKKCERKTGSRSYISALQWHAKAARRNLDRLDHEGAGEQQRELETLKGHLHACVSMIDLMLYASETGGVDAIIRRFVAGSCYGTPTPFTH